MKFSIFLFIALFALSVCAKKKTIYLIPHGETNFNTDPVPRVRGRINVPLNDEGIAHCKAAGDFLADLDRTKTVILKDLKSDKVTLIEKDYKVSVSKKGYRYLGIWSADPNANFICIEPWLSNNDIKPSDNPFREDFELEYLKPNESFKIGYTIEVE